ncbi:MAG TPA: sigma-70 family RNA polymerase sigma factor [Actinomycetota bacterium]|jgi:RNA polymerase sigma-70 factor (ECF subfamily)
MAQAFLPGMHDTGREQMSIGAVLPPTFEDFFVDHVKDVYGAVWLVTRNRQEAEDITQDAFLKVWERWDRVSTLDDPVGYLYVTAMNLWRSRGRRAGLAVRKVVHVARPDDETTRVDATDAVVRALAPLSERQRAALVLTDLLGFTSEQAARAIGIRPSSVRVLAKRARDRVRTTLEDQR